MSLAIQQILTKILNQMGISEVDVEVIPTKDLKYGDYTTNVALVLSKKIKKNPIHIAQEIVNFITTQNLVPKVGENKQNISKISQKVSLTNSQNFVLQGVEKIKIAAPGFINFFISTSTLGNQLMKALKEKEGFGTLKSSQLSEASGQRESSKNQKLQTTDRQSQAKRIMVEFAHPNTHKAFHIGHLRNITIGESLVRLFEAQGNEVIRSNYQGDVGMHIAKCLYGILQNQKSKIKSQNFLAENKMKSSAEKAELLGKMYAIGSRAYEEKEKAKNEIQELNFLIYAAAAKFAREKSLPETSTDYLSFVKNKDRLDEVYKLWKETRQWSLDYFDSIYKRVYSKFDRLYFESECLVGVDVAKEALEKGILTESDGAIIFDGTPYGLDKRVFVNSMGLPTYEGKELALAKMEFSEFGKIDQVIHVVGPEQASFFQVTFKVEEMLGIIDRLDRQKHLIYGWVRLKRGKMSSRLGNVVLGEWLLDEVKKAVSKIIKSSSVSRESSQINPSSTFLKKSESNEKFEIDEIAEKVAVAAVKYSFLKVSTTQEIAFDIEESVNLNGDSGPYLLYTYARCRSVLRKAAVTIPKKSKLNFVLKAKLYQNLNKEELMVLRLIYRFPEIVKEAATNYAPNLLCKYLYDLASSFNRFYNKHTILGRIYDVAADKPLTSDELNDPNYLDKSAVEDEIIPHSNKEKMSFRLALTSATAQTLTNGLHLLGIKTLERM